LSRTVGVLAPIAVSTLCRVEVPAALWRKHRIGEIGASRTRGLVERFESDFYGDVVTSPRFVVIPLLPELLDEAAELIGRYGLRAYDGVQLASAGAARVIDPDFGRFACFDKALREAALAEGFALVPA
jgi:predicted nucleic acid-binding protein